MDRALTFSTFTLDVHDFCLWQNGARLDLSPKDFALLRYLLVHRGRTISHAELLQAVWGATSVGPEVLKVRIGRLRRLLGDDASSPSFIRNVHGEGYRFVAQPLVSSFAPTTPVVGRKAQLAQLEDLLLEAAAGNRQIVFVAGEPGIGKTALIELFVERAAHLHLRAAGTAPADGTNGGPSRLWIGRGQCVEHYGSGESFLPVMEAMGRLVRGDGRERLKSVLQRHAPSWLLEMPALLNDAEREVLQRQLLAPAPGRMLRELAEALEVLTVAGEGGEPPVLILVLEDLHWADTSTLDLLAALAHRRDRAGLLVVGSYRPLELSGAGHPLRRLLQDLRARDSVTELVLGPLTESDVARYLEARFPAAEFPPELAELLHRRTDGNPLFFTDVVRDLLSRNVIERVQERWICRGDVSAVDTMIPPSMRQLMMRLRERLPAQDQRLLEAASIEGLVFSATAVAAALERGAAEVEEQCLSLVEHQQFLRPAGTDEWPDATRVSRFAFLHAVHRDLWQERVGAGRQQEWHLRIGQRKEAGHLGRCGDIAAELALHFEGGGDYRRAVGYLEQASRLALRRAAATEADAHLRRGFALLEKLEAGRERLRYELRLQLGLGSLMAMTEGYEAEGTARVYHRAHALSREIGEAPDLFHPLFGLCRYFWMKGEHRPAGDLAEQLLRIEQQDPDPAREIAAHTAFGSVAFCRGDLQEARSHLEAGLALCATHWNDSHVPVFGNDLETVCLGTVASTLQLLGYPDQGAIHLRSLLAGAREGAHPLAEKSVAFGAALFHRIRGETAQASHFADLMVSIDSREESSNFLTFRDVLRGWASIEHGRLSEGITELLRALETLQMSGARCFEPYVYGALAHGYQAMGRIAEARRAVVEALATSNRSGEHWYDAELLRLDAELIAASPRAADDAEARFRQAIETARRQSAKFWELRAVLALASLWRRRGDVRRGRELVAETYAGFTEGFDTLDLRHARDVLECGA